MPRPQDWKTIQDRYVEALGGADPLESQSKAPARVRRLVRGLSERQLARRPAPGKWSIKEVVAHLADGEIVFGARVRMIAAHDRPPIPAYDQDLFVERLGIDRTSTSELLEHFAMARAVNVALLRRLPPGAFDRAGLHAERGEESIARMVEVYAGHDRIHERQIERVRSALQGERAKPARRRRPARAAR
jgi:hypothetical protein